MKILTKSEQQRIQHETQQLQRALADREQQLSALRQDAADKTAAASAEIAALTDQLQQARQQQASTSEALEQQKQLAQQIREQFDKALASHQQAQDQAREQTRQQLAQADSQRAQLQSQLDKALQTIATLQQQVGDAQQALKDKAAQLQQAEQKLQSVTQQFQAEQHNLKTSEQKRAEAAQQLTQLQKDLADSRQKLQTAEQELAKQQQTAQQAHKSQLQLEQSLQSQKQANDKLRQDLAASDKKLTQLKAQNDDATQEHELLLLQLMQAQEELVEYYEQKNDFEKLYLAYKARWDRLEQRQPQYVDFGVIEIASFDHLSEVPSIVWRLKDFAHGDSVVSDFLFGTVIDQGHPGIGLCAAPDQPFQAFAPMLLSQDAAHLARFRAYSSPAYRQLLAGAHVLEMLEASQWQGFAWPDGLDAAFWRPTLRALGAQVKALPPVLRYDQVRLKRELINPDYEHLWLEFSDLTFGSKRLRKFEVRLGASLVQPGGFSRLPKFELPLIDGKHKPFESWYAESHDEHGSKLELRFSLDSQRLDLGVFSKLSKDDQLFMLQLVQTMPQALAALAQQQVAIHRPWSTWQDFAQEALNVVKALQSATVQKPKPAPTAPRSLPAVPVVPAVPTSAPLAAAQVIRVAPTAEPKARRATSKATPVKATAAKPSSAKVASAKASPAKATVIPAPARPASRRKAVS